MTIVESYVEQVIVFPIVHQKRLVKTCSNELLDFWTLFIYIYKTCYNIVESGSVPTQKQSRSITCNIEFFFKYKEMRKFRNLVI